MNRFNHAGYSNPLKSCLDRAIKDVAQIQESDMWEIRKTLQEINRERGDMGPLPSSIREIQNLFADKSSFRRAVRKLKTTPIPNQECESKQLATSF